MIASAAEEPRAEADRVTQLVECREEKRLQRLHKQLQPLHLLVIDKLGYVPFSKRSLAPNDSPAIGCTGH